MCQVSFCIQWAKYCGLTVMQMMMYTLLAMKLLISGNMRCAVKNAVANSPPPRPSIQG